MIAALGAVVVVMMQAGTTTDWKAQAPSENGWRAVTPSMTVDEVTRALAGEESTTKKVKYSDGASGWQTQLKKRIRVDGIEYEVSVYFDAEKHLQSIALFSNKVKKQTFAEVTVALVGLFGEPTNKEETAGPDGSKTETTSWKRNGTTLRVTYATVPLGGFVTGRIVTVVMAYN
ncbi:MAG: hypothetical protein U0599_02595 [Vicinamibacteria bacterium]